MTLIVFCNKKIFLRIVVLILSLNDLLDKEASPNQKWLQLEYLNLLSIYVAKRLNPSLSINRILLKLLFAYRHNVYFVVFEGNVFGFCRPFLLDSFLDLSIIKALKQIEYQRLWRTISMINILKINLNWCRVFPLVLCEHLFI